MPEALVPAARAARLPLPARGGLPWCKARRQVFLVLLWLVLGTVPSLLPTLAQAEARLVEATGRAVIEGGAGMDAARRRALEDALLAAALQGGAEVRGHTITNQSVITSDTTLVRPAAQVLDYGIMAEGQSGPFWQVTVRALIGPPPQAGCSARRHLQITAYQPQLRMDPQVPAWGIEVAGAVTDQLLAALDRHPAVSLRRATGTPLPDAGRTAPGFDYTALTRGSTAPAPGDLAFVPVFTLTLAAGGNSLSGARVVLDTDLQLRAGGTTLAAQQVLRSETRLPPHLPLRSASVLAGQTRLQMAAELAQGVDRQLVALVDQLLCQPMTAQLTLAGGRLTVPLGRRHGLTPQSLAFTRGEDTPWNILEIVQLGDASAELRPIDRNRPLNSLAGRTIQFMAAAR
ncbi:flagellar assembly protein T N-terminal domain-containing protein [Plastorhodobacter daqingensis]|uniref:Flagellar assembly protein T N-terminal domain-containing protein n=1 Tax=Plastorhodobacter daqingensis TaxID=1387281 RepID=A0ABW2UHX2_9RHOB